MTTTATPAGSVRIGQKIETIPSIASGTVTVLSGVVTDIEEFQILGHHFVDLHLGQRLTLTLGAPVHVNVIR